jgi:hypothetical protein
LFAYGIFEVIYAPKKAFKEITQNPKYIGPLLIIILFIAANAGFGYILASKTYYEQTLPSGATPQYDEWTQNKSWWPSNATNANVSESSDALSGVEFYGNESIEFDVINGKEIWMQTNFNQSVNCSGVDGYNNMSFRIKMIYPNTTTLVNASMYLFSSQADSFRYNLTGYSLLSNSTLWYNLTIPIGPTSGWTNSSNSADWSSIISLKYDFLWSANANLTIRLDGLFFRGIFKSAIEEVGTSNYLINYSLMAFMQFVITWVLLGGIMYIMSRGLGGKTVWKPMLIVAGYALIVLFVQMAINVILAANLPNLYYPLEFRGGVNGEGQSALDALAASTALASQISSLVNIAAIFWIVSLCAIVIRELTGFSWSKGFLVAVVAYFVSTIVSNLILSL